MRGSNSDKFDVISISRKILIGYFFEVELEYSDELHELHYDYPLTPENLAVFSDILLKCCKTFLISMR